MEVDFCVTARARAMCGSAERRSGRNPVMSMLRSLAAEEPNERSGGSMGLREAWTAGDLSRFHGWNKRADMEDASIAQKKR